LVEKLWIHPPFGIILADGRNHHEFIEERRKSPRRFYRLGKRLLFPIRNYFSQFPNQHEEILILKLRKERLKFSQLPNRGVMLRFTIDRPFGGVQLSEGKDLPQEEA